MRVRIKDNEKVIETVRMYYIMLIPIILKAIILSLPSFYWLLYIDNPISNIVSLLLLIILTLYVFFNWICWRYNTYIITDQRVIETKFFGIFTRHVAEVPLENIKNMKAKVYGLIPSLASFGTITIYTLSQSHIYLLNIPNPMRVQSLISELRENHTKSEKNL